MAASKPETKDRAARAREARRRHYARERAPVEPVAPIRRPPAQRAPVAEKLGRPCPARNKAWLAAVAAKALEMAKVLASADVPKDVREMRDAACAACPHSTLARGQT